MTSQYEHARGRTEYAPDDSSRNHLVDENEMSVLRGEVYGLRSYLERLDKRIADLEAPESRKAGTQQLLYDLATLLDTQIERLLHACDLDAYVRELRRRAQEILKDR